VLVALEVVYMIVLSLPVPQSGDVVGSMTDVVMEQLEYLRRLKTADANGVEGALDGFPESFVDALRELDMHDMEMELRRGQDGHVLLVLS
jgi:hypothetical protein